MLILPLPLSSSHLAQDADDDVDTDGATTGPPTHGASHSAAVNVEQQPLIDGDENECTMLLGPAKPPQYKGKSFGTPIKQSNAFLNVLIVFYLSLFYHILTSICYLLFIWFWGISVISPTWQYVV